MFVRVVLAFVAKYVVKLCDRFFFCPSVLQVLALKALTTLRIAVSNDLCSISSRFSAYSQDLGDVPITVAVLQSLEMPKYARRGGFCFLCILVVKEALEESPALVVHPY